LLAIFGFRPSIAAQQSSLKSTKSEKIGRLLMPKRMIAAVAALALSNGAALAQEVKVGVVLSSTGIGAEFAQQIDRGMELYLKLNADQVKPYTIKLIKRDSKAPNGAEAKVAVQELLTQDKVDALAGFVYSPDAIASAPVIAAGKKLSVIMNAGTAFITNLAPEYVRTSFTDRSGEEPVQGACSRPVRAEEVIGRIVSVLRPGRASPLP
jgi:branched-chain amino acid transport system substrate-binding protein